MFRRIAIIFIILLESGVFYAGSPVMLVRCGRPGLSVDGIIATGCDELGNFISFEGQCYAIPEDGECPNYPESMVLVPMDVVLLGDTISICVPNCESTCGEGCTTVPVWDAEELRCGCEDDGSSEGRTPLDIDFSDCDCPFFLELNAPSKIPGVAVELLPFGCLLPGKECYDLGIQYTIEPFVCDGPEAISDTIRIIIKGQTGATTPLRPGDALTITDLQNCNLLDDTQELLSLTALYGDETEAAFVADDEGCIVLEFTRDPSEETKIVLLGADTTITIPVCPRVFDPCSCTNPNNVTDADGVVEFWYDEMTFVGTASAPVILKSNNTPEGFLTLSQGIIANGTVLGTPGADSTLTVPFLRTPGIDTDIELTQTISGVERSTFLKSDCQLAVDACVAKSIPTIEEWGLMMLALLLLIFGVVSFSPKVLKSL